MEATQGRRFRESLGVPPTAHDVNEENRDQNLGYHPYPNKYYRNPYQPYPPKPSNYYPPNHPYRHYYYTTTTTPPTTTTASVLNLAKKSSKFRI